MRRVALLLVAASVLSIGVSAAPAQAAKEKKITDCKKDKKLNENLSAAFQGFLSGTSGVESGKTVENGDKIAPAIQLGKAANPNPTSKTWVVGLAAKCDGKKASTFTYDLAITPSTETTAPTKGLGLNFAGDGVLDKKTGKWLISALTVCDLIGKNPATPTAGPQCLAAAGG